MDFKDVSKESFIAWKNDPVTKEVLSMVSQERENAKEMIVQGRWKGDELNQVIGFCVGLNIVLNVEFTEEITHAESDSVEGISQA
jgi:DNA-binding protein